MDFRKISISDRELIEKYLKSANLNIAEHCFTSFYMWQDYYATQFCEDGEFLYIKSKSSPNGENYFMCPVGTGDLKGAINKLYNEFGKDITLVSITQQMKEKLEQLMPGELEFSELRDSADYIYLAQRLITLSGKKLQSKRNFVNRFLKEYGDNYSFEPITNENKQKAWEFHLSWSKQSESEQENLSLIAETSAIKKLLDNFDELCAVGGMLYVGTEVVGFTISTKSTQNMAVVHTEKCNIEYSGVYQMINKLFVETMLSDMEYINREEDMGIEGLRKAKMSYIPDILQMKYSAVRRKQ